MILDMDNMATETGIDDVQVNNNNSVSNIVSIEYLSPKNAEFTISPNGFLQLAATVPNPEKDNFPERIEFERVFLHRAFPFEKPYQFISVFGAFPKYANTNGNSNDNSEKPDITTATDINADEINESDTVKEKENEHEKSDRKKNKSDAFGDIREIGIIADIRMFGELVQRHLISTLNNKYFTSIIEVIHSIKDKYGYSYWEVTTNAGRTKFTVHDTHRSMLKVTNDRVIINDINGNRYEIPSLENFDKNSFRKIELFL